MRVIREIRCDNMLMNAIDAAPLGLVDGDTCLIESAHGEIPRRVTIIEVIKPGVVSLGEGNWVDLADGTGIDRAYRRNAWMPLTRMSFAPKKLRRLKRMSSL